MCVCACTGDTTGETVKCVYIREAGVYLGEIKEERQCMLGNRVHCITFSQPLYNLPSHLNPNQPSGIHLGLYFNMTFLTKYVYEADFNQSFIEPYTPDSKCTSFVLLLNYLPCFKCAKHEPTPTHFLFPILSVQVYRSHRCPTDTVTVGGTSSGSR